MSEFIRSYLQGPAIEIRNLLEENLSNGAYEQRIRDKMLLEELNYWLGEENAAKVDE